VQGPPSIRLNLRALSGARLSDMLHLYPRNPEIRLRLARLYALNGENAKAIFEYMSYLRFRPHDRQVSDELQGLTAHLKQAGHLPSMRIFEAMVDIVKRHGTADTMKNRSSSAVRS